MAMKRELLLECASDEIRAAVLEDGRLCEIYQEGVNHKKLTETLFLGRVQSIRPTVGAAFVDIGEALHAFLPLKEGTSLRCGDMIIVQGTAVQSVDTKGLRISDTVNLAGKWLVLIPGERGVRYSKKIKDPQLRAALAEWVEPLCPEGCGLIVRTASADVDPDALAEEVEILRKRWDQITVKAAGMTKPGVLFEPLDLGMRLVRDIGNTLSRVVSSDEDTIGRLTAARNDGWLSPETEIVRFDESAGLMNDVFSLDAQVDKALKKRVWLDCGGYLVFDACEALTVIDVNSGKMILGKDTEDNALRVNLQAAEEIARQLRLRNIGGIIVVDYIDMKMEEHREALLQRIKACSQADRSVVTVGGMTRLGLVEMTRKRQGEQLDRSLQVQCKTCTGNGRFLSGEEVARRALRQVRRMEIAGQRGPFLIRCAAQTASALQNLSAEKLHAPVYALAEGGRHAERFEIEQLDFSAALPKGAMQLRKG